MQVVCRAGVGVGEGHYWTINVANATSSLEAQRTRYVRPSLCSLKALNASAAEASYLASVESVAYFDVAYFEPLSDDGAYDASGDPSRFWASYDRGRDALDTQGFQVLELEGENFGPVTANYGMMAEVAPNDVKAAYGRGLYNRSDWRNGDWAASGYSAAVEVRLLVSIPCHNMARQSNPIQIMAGAFAAPIRLESPGYCYVFLATLTLPFFCSRRDILLADEPNDRKNNPRTVVAEALWWTRSSRRRHATWFRATRRCGA